MTLLAQLALRFAVEQRGVREDPPGSNRGPEIDQYLRWAARAGLIDPDVLLAGRKGKAWCAIFACWAVEQGVRVMPVGFKPKLKYSARCERLVELNRDLQIPRPEPGCLFVHVKPGDGDGHCGFVATCGPTDDGGYFHVGPEGNTDTAGGRTGGQVLDTNMRRAGYAQAFIRIE